MSTARMLARRVAATLWPSRWVRGHPEEARQAAVAAVRRMPLRQRWVLLGPARTTKETP